MNSSSQTTSSSGQTWAGSAKKKRRESNRIEQRTGTVTLEPVERYTFKGFLIFAALLCCIYGGQSLRQAVKTLEIFNHLLNGQLGRIPCHTTVETWVAKSGLAALKGSAKSIKEAYSLIMDASISVGDQQLLLLLKIPAGHQGHAMKHTDVEVADMKVATNWPAESVKGMVLGIIDREQTRPEYLLSDNGSNLRKAAQQAAIPHHRDVSHTLATYLKQVYEKDPEYMAFSEQIGKTKHLALTDVGYLMPCKQRRMARFMNLYPIVDWADSMLENFHILGKKEKYHYSFIQGNAGLISELSEVLTLFEDLMAILKKEGLSQATAARCKAIASKSMLPGGERTRRLCELICHYLDKESQLLKDEDDVRNISSDIEESSFGLLKDSMPTCKTAGFTECVLRLPLYSRLREFGRINVSQIARWMADTRMADVKLWKNQNLRPNPLVKRRKSLTRMTQKQGTSY